MIHRAVVESEPAGNAKGDLNMQGRVVGKLFSLTPKVFEITRRTTVAERVGFDAVGWVVIQARICVKIGS